MTNEGNLSEIALFTDNVQACVSFYTTLLKRGPETESDGLATFDIGGVTLLIHEIQSSSDNKAPPEDHIAVKVEQLATATNELFGEGEINPWGCDAPRQESSTSTT